jgi:uncharacterized protein (DUF362 family)/Pyruvate/2-oxoacid:ferredoxin oxidoreductase delta subunit
MKSTVSIKELRTYDPEQAERAVRACLEPLGGIREFVDPGQTVLLKPNILQGRAPARAVTTHPSILRALIRLVQELGARVLVGDNPGVGDPAQAARKSGILEVVRDLGAEWIDCAATREFDAPDNRVARRIALMRALAEADVLITLPKLKTHGQLSFTGAIKNQFGLVPGTRKARYHYRLNRPEWLARLLVDINRIAKPALALMDAVVGMEGLGPSGGRPREVGALIASSDLSAVDVVACHLIGLDPRVVPTVQAAAEVGYGATALDAIDTVGDPWQALQVPDFEKVREVVSVLRILPLPVVVQRWIRSQWQPRPKIDIAACVCCGACAEGCPVNPPAIDPFADQEPRVNDATCIRCYCCHEFCPHHAIDLELSNLAWLFRPLGRL